MGLFFVKQCKCDRKQSDSRIHPVHSVERQTRKHQTERSVTLQPSCRPTHHPAEVFIQNLHKVMDQLVDGQLILQVQRNSLESGG